MIDVGKTIDRIKLMLNMRKDIELARHFGRSPNNIYTWRERDSLDWRFLIEFFWDEDLNYIFKGESSERGAPDRISDNQSEYNAPDDPQKIIERQRIQIETLEGIIIKLKTVEK